MNHSRYTVESIAEIVGGKIYVNGKLVSKDEPVEHAGGYPFNETAVQELLIDSRRLVNPSGVMFVALVSDRNDGHRYIPELIERGVRCLLVGSEQYAVGSMQFATKEEGRRKKDEGRREKEKGEKSFEDPASGIRHPVFIVVPDTLAALQKLAAHHREQFSYPVVGITGSNGKTIVKEWLYQLLSPDQDVIRSPKSFNSQIGVPLSVWNMEDRHDMAIIEAGISETGEMEKLERIIRPAIGIFTNIGPAHDSGFSEMAEKVDEKLKLFRHAEVLIYRSDYNLITERLQATDDYSQLKTFTWGTRDEDDLRITGIRKEADKTVISTVCNGIAAEFTIPFTDDASVENAIHCRAFVQVQGSAPPQSSFSARGRFKVQGTGQRAQGTGIQVPVHLTPTPSPQGEGSKPPSGGLGVVPEGIPSGNLGAFANLASVAMRLELKEAINNCSLINDSYNADINSLGIALDFLAQQKQHPKRTVILSDILQTGRNPEEFYEEVASIVESRKVDRIIGIGEEISRFRDKFSIEKTFYRNTGEFQQHVPLSSFHNETILLKGARIFGFEHISQTLQQKAHETVLEINLDALVHNLNFFRAKLKPGVLTMAMVKAFSYGSGSFEIASLLQFHQVDYLAVAYTDEGVELRKAGITMPIMVMSPEEQSMEAILTWNLEPEIYSFRILRMLEEAMKRNEVSSGQEVRIHIKLDTGMHRLGFCEPDLEELVSVLKKNPQLRIRSVFSHLASSEDLQHDLFTREQFTRLLKMSSRITGELDYPVLLHILNSAGISRFPDMQLDMVRLGIGMYGLGYNKDEQHQLRNVSRMRTVVTQIKRVKSGDHIGYNLKGFAEEDKVIAIVPVGYADGLSRQLGNGRGKMLIGGQPVPTIGNICMDLCMLDITGLKDAGIMVNEGDEVLVFGDALLVSALAETLETIPYEIMTGISRRVKRIYYHE